MEHFEIFYKVKKAIEFAERWVCKTKDYQDLKLSDCFDKFFSLYVAYNHIYNTINNLAEYYEIRLDKLKKKEATEK